MEIKTRKKGNILNININGQNFYAWFWTSNCIYKEKKENLVKNNSWLIGLEGKNFNKDIVVKNCLEISPYYKGDNYLKNKKARNILINKVTENINNL